MTLLESALIAARMGFHVFPVKSKSKVAAIADFPNLATSDPTQITKWWTNGYSNSNIGISTTHFKESEALLVVDVDQKEGKMGEDTIFRLENLEGLEFPATFEVKTPSGGRHLYYSVPAPVKQGVNVLGPGVDIRSRGGYVLFSRSVLSNGEYVLGNGKIVPAPEWLRTRCGRPTEKPDSGAEQSAYPVNRENALSRARFYLENEAPAAVQGSGGDQTTFKVICRVKDFGVSENDCGLILEGWNNKCQPPWDFNELYTKIGNAYRYGERIQGIDSPEASFTKIEAEPTPRKRSSLYGEKGRDVEPNFDQQYLVDKYLSPNAMSVVYGESNSGKTFFALDLGMHISLGQPWQGKPTLKGLVIYIAAEGGWGIRKRIKAFRKYHNLEGKDFPFVLVPCPVDLLNEKTHVQELTELIKQYEVEFKMKCELIVIDTLARALGSGNENAPNDMGAFVKNTDSVRQNTKAHMMVIRHSGKDVAKGARGHSSLRAATDTEIEVSSSPTHSCNIAKVKKQRDMEFGPDIGFSLKQIDIGQSPDGQTVHSCVVIPANLAVISDFSKQALDPRTLPGKAFKALNEALRWTPQPAPNELDLDDDKTVVSVDEWREAFFKEAYPGKDKTKAWYNAFNRTAETLVEGGHAHKTEIWAWIG